MLTYFILSFLTFHQQLNNIHCRVKNTGIFSFSTQEHSITRPSLFQLAIGHRTNRNDEALPLKKMVTTN